MSIVWSIIWGILVFFTTNFTIKYYLPRLSKRILTENSESLVDSKDEEMNIQLVGDANDNVVSTVEQIEYIFRNKEKKIIVIALSVIFATVCGYAAGNNAVSFVDMLKMTLTFVILSCIFITDLELLIIPNICSIILIIGRVISIVYEFIRVSDKALILLFNSVLALIICLLMLFVSSKITKGGIGYGDIKILSSVGFLCGIRAALYTLLFSFLLCAILSSLLLISKKKKLKDSLPLGPFIWIGYGVSILLSII